eukprot:12889282-Prorocentrum_lima.AAC.1
MTVPWKGVNAMRTLQKPLGPLSRQELHQVHGALLSMKHWPAVLRFLGKYPARAELRPAHGLSP